MIPINPLYNYGAINRVEDNSGRKYVDPNGNKIASVTTILGKSRDMSHLDEWKKRIGEDAANQITRESADLGTMMHTHLERFIKREDRPGGTNLGRVMARNMADVIIEQGLNNVEEVWGIEVPLIYDTLWAGTTDVVGVWKGKPAIMDFKTTIRPKKRDRVDDYRLQLTAYRMAHNFAFGTKIETCVVFMCSRDLTYQEFEFDSSGFDQDEIYWVSRVEKYYTDHVFSR